jgi:signal transduction histidine kinase
MPPTWNNKVLVVEDDPDAQANLRDVLELAGYRVEVTASGSEALARLSGPDFFAILLDRRLPDGTADTLLPLFLQKAPQVPIIILTGYADLDGVLTAIRFGVADYLPKPISVDLLRATLERIARAQDAERRARDAERLAGIGQAAAVLAHEGRNALQQTICNLAILAAKLPDRPELLDLIDRARNAQRGLARLLEDLYSYAAPLALRREVLRLGDVWREAWSDLKDSRQKKAGQLQETIQGDALSGDRFRLKQVFRNLFENALAACATPARIEVHCTQAGHPDGHPVVWVAVSDNGPGLSPEQRQRAFDLFYTTKSKGTGFGLAITKRIVEAHGGQISVDNGDGTGARFLIVLPQGKEPSPAVGGCQPLPGG